MKLNIILLIVGLAIIPIQICLCEDYKPLTDEEITGYWESLTIKQKIQEIRKLDIIEHAIPLIEPFEFGAVLKKDGDLIIWPLSEMTIHIAYLEYDILLPSICVRDFSNDKIQNVSMYIYVPSICISISIINVMIGGADKMYQYLLSGSIGLLSGILIDIFLISKI